MRLTPVAALVALGLALVGAIQWVAEGLPGLPLQPPAPWGGLLPLFAFAAYGLYLGAVYGGGVGALLGTSSALCALAVAALPLAYAYGLAQRYGLPADGGALGALYAGQLARAAAALWFAVALVAALRGPRRTGLRLARAAERGAVVPPQPLPGDAAPPGQVLWSPAPVLPVEDGGPGPVAFSPPDPGPGS